MKRRSDAPGVSTSGFATHPAGQALIALGSAGLVLLAGSDVQRQTPPAAGTVHLVPFTLQRAGGQAVRGEEGLERQRAAAR